MKPARFDYHAPATLPEALALLSRLDNAKILAGGQSLMPMLNFRFIQPDHLVDLCRIPGLSGIELRDDHLHIGAMTPQRDIEFSPLVARHCPILRDAIIDVGHRQTRNRGTIGGSLCHFDPAAELVAMAAVHDATIEIASSAGRRELGFADFALDFMTTALAPDEIVTGLRLPLWPMGHGFAFIEFARRHGDFAIVSTACLLQQGADGNFARVSLVLGGAGARPIRLTAAEAMLMGEAPGSDRLEGAAQTCRDIDALDDALVSASYRRRLAEVLVRRALVQARDRMARRA